MIEMNKSQPGMVGLVAATRKSESEFHQTAPLGISLARLNHDQRLRPLIFYSNDRSLPEVYNEAIARLECQWLVFVHDDVWLDDFFLVDHIRQGMREFHVLGVAGNRRCLAGHAGWAFINRAFDSDGPEHLSGSIALGANPFGQVLHFGPVPQPCELLDGVFLAADREALVREFVAFDPRFDFHFYDLDFCRSARRAGLKLGTWPIPITHASPGAFGSPEWEACHGRYVAKWEDQRQL